MNNEIQYTERMPKYVYNGCANERSSIMIVQWLIRLFVIFIIYVMVDSFLIGKTLGASPIDYIGLFVAVLAVSILLHDSEIIRRKELDGNVAIVIKGDTLSSTEPYHRIVNRQLSTNRNDIDHVEIIRGDGEQRVGKKESVLWFDTMIGLKIVDKDGKKFDVGYKPPMTVKEISDFLGDRWGIPIRDNGSGMGHGKRYSHGNILWDRSYEEIMQMNLFEWQK